MPPVESWFKQVRELASEHKGITLDDVAAVTPLIKRELFLEKQAARFGFRVRLFWDQKQQSYHIVGHLG